MRKVIQLAAVLALTVAASACMRHRTDIAHTRDLEDADARIITTLIALHQGEIDAARIAVVRSTDQNVQGFAVRAQTSHDAAIERLQSIARREAFIPSGTELSQSVVLATSRTAYSLNAASLEHFDASYLGTRYNAYLKFIALLDLVLIPQIVDDELRAEVRAERESAARHFDHIQTVRAQVAATNELRRQRASR